MQVVIPRRLTGPATLIVALAALAGCGTGGNGAAAGAASASARPSTVASVSALPSTPAKPSATAASASAKPPGTVSAAPARTLSAPPPTPRSALAPSALLDDAVSDMQAQASVHISCTLSSPSDNEAESEDIGATSGRSVDTAGNVSISNLLVSGIDYTSTNTAGVLAANGIPEAEAEKLAGEWISMRPGDSYRGGYLSYANGIHGMTMASQASELRMAGPLKRTGAAVVDGRDVYGVSGTASIYYSVTVNGKPQSPTETVYIAASGAPLPVRVSAHTSNGTGQTCDFSNWGERLGLTAPAHAVPITSIPAS